MQFVLDKRFFKKLFYGAFYLTLASLLVFFLAKKTIFKPQPSRPRPIQEPSILEAKFVPSSPKEGDVVLKVKNPNDDMGLRSFLYQVSLLDESGAILAQREDYDFLLPAQTKYIFSFSWPFEEKEVKHIKVKLSSFDWVKFQRDWHPYLTIRSIVGHLGMSPDEPYYWLEAILTNHSPLDLKKVELKAVIRDSQNKIIAVSQTSQEEVKSLEERYFKIVWPEPVLRMRGKDINFFKIEIYPEVNFINYF